MPPDENWILVEQDFDPANQHHRETIFTIGNGYLSTRGVYEEGYPGESRATLLHGVFDAAPIVVTELANAPDWLPLSVWLDGERFSLDQGKIESYSRSLDLRTGLLTRSVRWSSPRGKTATLTFERFASLADPHRLFLRCRVVPEFEGQVEFRSGLRGCVDNQGLAHWHWVGQGLSGEALYLHNRTRQSGIDLVSAFRLLPEAGQVLDSTVWETENEPTLVVKMAARAGDALVVEKHIAFFTSRDTFQPVAAALESIQQEVRWEQAWEAHARAWEHAWESSDVIIEGDDEAQISLRFNLYHLLIAAPRQDEWVSIGAKSLSGFGYRGHAFWDTETFMMPLFTYTAPEIARNLLNYRYHTLPGARRKAQANGYTGAQFAWESADTGDEVTPAWVPHFSEPGKLVRIWTGDIEIHISADIAYAVYTYWRTTGDDSWFRERGMELLLDTAKFWAARAEWNAATGMYEYRDVIGPDEYHEHVDNNAYTNRMAKWNLETALQALVWLDERAPEGSAELRARLNLTPERLEHWKHVAENIVQKSGPTGLIEQFDGYFQRKDVDLAAMEPRDRSAQVIFGIEGTNETQVLKQPDVLMLLYLLRDQYSSQALRVNYDYYTPRTDHTFGSSLGPSIQTIMACEVGLPDEAYEHFIRAARADLRNIRGNAGDGIHAASAGGTWQAAVFGFGGLHFSGDSWSANPRLPSHWKRLAFKFYYRGQQYQVDTGKLTES